MVGVVYPVYESFKAIESPLVQHMRNDAQWLTYWTIHGAFTLAEQLSGSLISWCVR